MKILDKAARLEKALLDRLGSRSDIVRHPLELVRAVLDDIEHACEPGGRGVRVFPYTDVTVWVAAPGGHQRATAEAVFAEPPGLEQRVRDRLRQRGCRTANSVRVSLKFADRPAENWIDREYQIEYRRRPEPHGSRTRTARKTERYELSISVLAGSASKQRHTFSADRINIGRLLDVVDRQHRLIRQNQVAFLDGGDDISQSVSRAHAHIHFDPNTGEARLHDDGSTHGTRIVRGGRTIDVPHGSSRGVRLREGDEIQLGQARLRVETRPRSR